MSKTNFQAVTVAATLLLAACRGSEQPAVRPAPTPNSNAAVGPTVSAPAAANNAADAWLGQWNGPEGTYLLLSKNGARYSVKIQSLDGPATYEGVAAGDRIEFERDGKTETIRAGSGRETGMKWLLEKKNCLVIKQGEGFCRD